MKRFLLVQTIVYSLFCFVAKGQNENWDTYVAKFGEKPGSVLIDMALMDHAPDKKYPYLVVTGPRAQACNSKGLPNKEEIPKLEEMLDATDNFLTGVTPKVLAATFTHNCDRLNYYYVKDTLGIRNALMRLYTRSFSNYKYTVSIIPDPAWLKYRTFLYPTEETQNWMETDKLISKMTQRGDSLNKPRDIKFDLFFRTDTDRNALVVFARNKGYKTDTLMTSKSAAAPFEVIVSRNGYLKMDFVAPMSAELKAVTKEHHGFYNGWEAK